MSTKTLHWNWPEVYVLSDTTAIVCVLSAMDILPESRTDPLYQERMRHIGQAHPNLITTEQMERPPIPFSLIRRWTCLSVYYDGCPPGSRVTSAMTLMPNALGVARESAHIDWTDGFVLMKLGVTGTIRWSEDPDFLGLPANDKSPIPRKVRKQLNGQLL